MCVQLLQVFRMAMLLSGSTQAATAQDTMKFQCVVLYAFRTNSVPVIYFHSSASTAMPLCSNNNNNNNNKAMPLWNSHFHIPLISFCLRLSITIIVNCKLPSIASLACSTNPYSLARCEGLTRVWNSKVVYVFFFLTTNSSCLTWTFLSFYGRLQAL